MHAFSPLCTYSLELLWCYYVLVCINCFKVLFSVNMFFVYLVAVPHLLRITRPDKYQRHATSLYANHWFWGNLGETPASLNHGMFARGHSGISGADQPNIPGCNAVPASGIWTIVWIHRMPGSQMTLISSCNSCSSLSSVGDLEETLPGWQVIRCQWPRRA